MDLKFKGTAWVGNIYQKFEAMCHEVDDLVTQDTFKYVENQVQTVSDSVVKRFCGVVQDLLPSSSLEPGNPEAQVVALEHNDNMGTCTKSTISSEEKSVYTDSNQSSVELGSITLINPLKVGHDQFIHLASANCIKVAEPDFYLGSEENASKDQKSDIFLEKNGTKEKLVYRKANVVFQESDTKEEWIDTKSNIIVEENDTKKELNDQNSDIAVEDNETKEELIDKKCETVVEENDTDWGPSWPEKLELTCSETEEVFEESFLCESADKKNGILAELPPATLHCLVRKDELTCNRFSDKVECVSDISTMFSPSEMDFSVFSSENKTADAGLISSSTSLSTESYSMSEFSQINVSQNEENLNYDPVEAIRRASDLPHALSFSQPFPVLSLDSNVPDLRLGSSSRVLSLESNEADTLNIDHAASVAGLYGSRHECHDECTELNASMSSLAIGEADDCRVAIADPSMETIELSTKEKLDNNCVIVDSKLLCAVSYRAQRHRSYKKILQDAFALRKRLRKEYEQLAILYGDIDTEFSQQPGQDILLFSPSSSIDSKKSSADDWELL